MTDRPKREHAAYHEKFTWPKRIALGLLGVPGMIAAGTYSIERIRHDAARDQALEIASWAGGIAFLGGFIMLLAGVLPSERLQKLLAYVGLAVVGSSVLLGPALA